MGEKRPPLTEKMNPSPISVYGGSKFSSEMFSEVFLKAII